MNVSSSRVTTHGSLSKLWQYTHKICAIQCVYVLYSIGFYIYVYLSMALLIGFISCPIGHRELWPETCSHAALPLPCLSLSLSVFVGWNSKLISLWFLLKNALFINTFIIRFDFSPLRWASSLMRTNELGLRWPSPTSGITGIIGIALDGRHNCCRFSNLSDFCVAFIVVQTRRIKFHNNI